MNGKLITSLALAAVCSIGTGCTSYYRVSNPATGAVYYTEKLDRMASGSVILKDEKTGDEITLDSSGIKEITRQEYEQATSGQPASTQP